MTFWQKIKQTLRSFMDGRHGADQLSMALLWAGLIAYLLGTIFSGVQGFFLWPLLGILLTLAGIAAYVLCIFRMFSRNNDKRSAENRRYLAMTERRRTARNAGIELAVVSPALIAPRKALYAGLRLLEKAAYGRAYLT